jgi:hypothetical protein
MGSSENFRLCRDVSRGSGFISSVRAIGDRKVVWKFKFVGVVVVVVGVTGSGLASDRSDMSSGGSG